MNNCFSLFLTLPGSKIILNITDRHLFLGYSPLIIGLAFDEKDEKLPQIIVSEFITLSYCINDHKFNSKGENIISKNNSIAKLKLKPAGEIFSGGTCLLLFEGIFGEHRFISQLHQFNNYLKGKLKKNKTGNVSLPGNLYEQVRIAYAFPRKISIISLGNGEYYNMFPTDLHGQLNEDIYIISLRYNGKACRQVETIEKITLSTAHLSFSAQAYTLGKNHMQEMKPIDAFPAHQSLSVLWQNPLPFGVLNYLELERIPEESAKIFGIHQLHFFRIIKKHTINSDPSTLSHIHNYYAQWRLNKGLQTEFILR